MTHQTPTPGNAPGLPMPRPFPEVHTDALTLHGVIYALDHILNEARASDLALQGAAHSLVMMARDMSRKLDDDLERHL